MEDRRSGYQLTDWVLRITVAAEFIGHGIFALNGKPDWIGWFAHFGVGDPELARWLLFGIGLLDIVMAVVVLIRPVQSLLAWMVFWAFWTALIRPLVGMPVWDFFERWANWGAPFALLMLHWHRFQKSEK